MANEAGRLAENSLLMTVLDFQPSKSISSLSTLSQALPVFPHEIILSSLFLLFRRFSVAVEQKNQTKKAEAQNLKTQTRKKLTTWETAFYNRLAYDVAVAIRI